MIEIFGDWIHDIENYSKDYQEANPFEHVIIPNFLNSNIANKLSTVFPTPLTYPSYKWHSYNNPFECKYALNDFKQEGLDIFNLVFSELQKDSTLNLIRKITNIENLESDPFLHGAGIHAYPSNGKLDMHLDYSIHPISGKERRVNIIYYLNKDWKDEWGGKLQLRNKNLSDESKKEIPVQFNSAVIFRTCDTSFHGIPKPISCPKDEFRKSLAIYYISDKREEATQRLKAQYYPLPGQPVSDALRRLYEIRTLRLLNEDDLLTLGPNWRSQGDGYW